MGTPEPQRLADLTEPPVVGRDYLVPCLVLPPKMSRALRAGVVPVLGPEHEDPSFAPLLGPHRHYDPRFLDLRTVRVRIPGLPPEQVALVIAHRVLPGDAVEERVLTCLRGMPPWPGGPPGSPGHDAAPWVGTLEEAHRLCRVGADGRCPHAGTDGRSFPRDTSGAWTCIHGLRWGRDGGLVSAGGRPPTGGGPGAALVPAPACPRRTAARSGTR